MAACYDLQNNENTEIFPCDGAPDLQQCCYPREHCASNGLCVTADEGNATPYFVHGCMDEDWQKGGTGCVTQCLNSTGNGVKPCGNGLFCCYGLSGCNCNDKSKVFTLEPVRIVYTVPSGTSRALSISSTSSLTSSQTSSSQSSNTSSSTTTPPSTQSQSSSTSSGDTIKFRPDGSAYIKEDAVKRGTRAMAIGLGLGIPLFLIALYLIWWMRRRKLSVKPRGEGELPNAYEKELVRLGELSGNGLPAEMARKEDDKVGSGVCEVEGRPGGRIVELDGEGRRGW